MMQIKQNANSCFYCRVMVYCYCGAVVAIALPQINISFISRALSKKCRNRNVSCNLIWLIGKFLECVKSSNFIRENRKLNFFLQNCWNFRNWLNIFSPAELWNDFHQLFPLIKSNPSSINKLPWVYFKIF